MGTLDDLFAVLLNQNKESLSPLRCFSTALISEATAMLVCLLLTSLEVVEGEAPTPFREPQDSLPNLPEASFTFVTFPWWFVVSFTRLTLHCGSLRPFVTMLLLLPATGDGLNLAHVKIRLAVSVGGFSMSGFEAFNLGAAQSSSASNLGRGRADRSVTFSSTGGGNSRGEARPCTSLLLSNGGRPTLGLGAARPAVPGGDKGGESRHNLLHFFLGRPGPLLMGLTDNGASDTSLELASGIDVFLGVSFESSRCFSRYLRWSSANFMRMFSSIASMISAEDEDGLVHKDTTC